MKRASGVLVAALLSWPTAAWADDGEYGEHAHDEHDEHDDMGHGRRHAMHPNLFGAKFGYISLFAPHEGEYEHVPLGYAGLFYERSVIHNWLEIELTVAGAFGARELAMPVDLYFKKPFHPAPWITPYFGGGPHLDVIFQPDGPLVLGGACLTLGFYAWFSERWGIDFDIDYAVAANRALVFHDVLAAIGPVARF